MHPFPSRVRHSKVWRASHRDIQFLVFNAVYVRSSTRTPYDNIRAGSSVGGRAWNSGSNIVAAIGYGRLPAATVQAL
jgi:hypothetical protein